MKYSTIGQRAHAEIERVFGNPKRASGVIYVAAQSMYPWKNGTSAPRADTLALMHQAGCNVMWILIGGERNEHY